LFCGAVGKSAQFPLHVWLPDAMEGPTPVSALIHAATMVTAGVYLVARCTPLFFLAPNAQLTVACVGGFTALFAALIALTQNDLKRVLAYSTISQLGYMFLAVGSGAVVAGMFHLVTHAFFKALLFLAAGSVMHAMGGVIDMKRLGGLRKLLPITHATFLVGAAALSAVPFVTAGFWSKDEVLAGDWFHTMAAGPDWVYKLLFFVALFAAGLTAFYTFRAYFLTFWGAEKVPPEAHGHAHESPPVMWVPLTVLAAGALLVGFVNTPWYPALFNFLHGSPDLKALHHDEIPLWQTVLFWAGSIAVAAAGIGGAYFVYVRRPGTAERMARDYELAYVASSNKFFIDDLYEAVVVKPLTWLTVVANTIDFVVDEIVNLVARLVQLLGRMFRPVQNGLLQFYALAIILALTVFLLALARSP
jgi:NADH-quinone oxidoreductase subunit L